MQVAAPTECAIGRLGRGSLLAEDAQAFGKGEIAAAVLGVGVVGERVVVVLHEEARDLAVEIAEGGKSVHAGPVVAGEVDVDGVDGTVVVVNGVAGVDHEVGFQCEHRRIDRKAVGAVAIFILLATHHCERRGGIGGGERCGDEGAGGGTRDGGVGARAVFDGDRVARAGSELSERESGGEIARRIDVAPSGFRPCGGGRGGGAITHAGLTRRAEGGPADGGEASAGGERELGAGVGVGGVVAERNVFSRGAIEELRDGQRAIVGGALGLAGDARPHGDGVGGGLGELDAGGLVGVARSGEGRGEREQPEGVGVIHGEEEGALQVKRGPTSVASHGMEPSTAARARGMKRNGASNCRWSTRLSTAWRVKRV